MPKRVLVFLFSLLSTLIVPAPATAAVPTYTALPSYAINGAPAVENFVFINGIGTWSGVTSYRFEFYSCDAPHAGVSSLPAGCTLMQTSTNNARYDIEASDQGGYLMGVVVGINADGETAGFLDTIGPVVAQATHACPLGYVITGDGISTSTCTKVVEDAAGGSGPLYHLYTGVYSMVVEGGDGGSAVYGANTILGGHGARVSFELSTPAYAWYTSYWNMSFSAGGDGTDSQPWVDSYCSNERNYTQGAGLYYTANDGQTGSFGGAVSYLSLSVSSATVAYAYAGGGGGAGCMGGVGGNAGGVATTAVDRSTTDTIYVAYGEDGAADTYTGGTGATGGSAKTIAGGGAGGVGLAPGNTTTLQGCLDGKQNYGGGGNPSYFTYGSCGIFAADFLSGASIAEYSYANPKIWEGGAGGRGFSGTIDGTSYNLAGYAGGHVDYSEDSDYGGGGGAGGGTVYKLGTESTTYFSSLVVEQNQRSVTQGMYSISMPAQPVPDEPTITGITEGGSSGTAVVTVEAPATGVVTAQFVVHQQGGAGQCSGVFDQVTGIGTCTVGGLTVGSSYDFAPRAYNPFGYSSRGPVETYTVLGDPPVNTVAPTVSGTARVNATLTANAGTWTGATGSATYQWYSCDSSVSVASLTLSAAAPHNCVEISGATSSTYALTASEEGKYVLVGETRVASDGAPATMYSTSTGAVAAALPAPTFTSVSSTPYNAVGDTILLTVSTTNSPTLTYQWYRCETSFSYVYTSVQAGCTAISGATEDSYTVTNADLGKYIYYYIVGSNGTAPDYTLFSGIATMVVAGSAPDAPTGVSASAGNATATISWNAVSGASTYTVTSNPGGLQCSTSGTSCNIGSLTNGVSYTFTVVATNDNGDSSSSSPSSAVTPSAGGSAPDSPTGVFASAGNASATIIWNAVAGATSYTVTTNPGGFQCETSGTSCTIGSLTNGVEYTFAIVATNGNGDSYPTNAVNSAVPSAEAAVPTAPTGVAATQDNNAINVTWNPVAGAAYYVLITNPNGPGCITAGTTCSVGGLTSGATYTFTIVAVNVSGASSESDPSNAVTLTEGGGGGGSTPTNNAPTAPKATAGNGSVSLSWTAVVGAVAYKVTSIPAGANCETITTTCTITGLTNGVNYFFTVTAVFGNGSLSQPSSLVGPVTPKGDPNAPVNDPKLNFVAPKESLRPGEVKTTTGGKNTATTTSAAAGSHELKLNFGKPGNGLVKLSGYVADSDSVLTLRKIDGLKSLVIENNSTLRVTGDGYSEGTSVQIYLQNVSTGNLIYLGASAIKKGGSFEFEVELEPTTMAGDYTLQINGLVYRNLEYKVRSTSVGAVVVDAAVQRVYFKENSSKLTKSAKTELQQNLTLLNSASALTMYSYTTGETTTSFQAVNKNLAKKRAQVLKDYLVKLGLDVTQIKIKVIGAVTPKNDLALWQNRRVDIYIKL